MLEPNKGRLSACDVFDLIFFPHHPENLLPKILHLSERGDGSPDRVSSSVSLSVVRNGITESTSTASTSMSSSKEHGNLPMVMPMIPPPLIKPPAGRWQTPRYSEMHKSMKEKLFSLCFGWRGSPANRKQAGED